jgi:peptidoglycan/xylan/chitin deacetylase (PgdA/CDA1 family)
VNPARALAACAVALLIACSDLPSAPAAAPAVTATPTPASPTVTATAPAELRTAAPAPSTPAAASVAEPVEVSRGNTARRELALSFDCGGHAAPTAAILEALREADVSVTFFMIGQWVEAYPELARAIAERHELANHSHAHPDYRELSDDAIARDLERAEAAVLAVTGRSTRPLWRAPSGERDARVLAAAARAGWPVHVFWTIDRDARGLVTADSGDWRGISAAEVAANLERAAALGGGVIAVAHCDSEATRQALPEVLRRLRAAGVRVTTVSEVLR